MLEVQCGGGAGASDIVSFCFKLRMLEAMNDRLEFNERSKGQQRIHRRIASPFWTVWKAEAWHLFLEDIEIYTLCDFVQSHLTGRNTLQSCHHSVVWVAWNWSFSNCYDNWKKKYFETLLAWSRELQYGDPSIRLPVPESSLWRLKKLNCFLIMFHLYTIHIF